MVRKGGFEPPRLSAPPPQDGVSASSTTSAGCKLHALNNLAISASQLRLHRILHRPFAFYTPLWRLQVREPHKQFLNGLLSRGCTERILVLMLSCPATYCNVKGSGYSSASGFRRGLMQAEESGQLRAGIASRRTSRTRSCSSGIAFLKSAGGVARMVFIPLPTSAYSSMPQGVLTTWLPDEMRVRVTRISRR